MQSFLKRKIISTGDAEAAHDALPPTLSWPHLLAMGVGAIVGTGILTLIGVGADRAGPAVLISFIIAGVICTCAALAYAELSTMMPVSGSSYTYSYVVLGEIFAWIVGWSLILEYSLVVSTVAVGWSGYAAPFLNGLFGIPQSLMQGPELGGIINLPAMVIIGIVAGLLSLGTRESATLNGFLVVLKIATLALFVAFALPSFDASNLEPFMPYGFSKSVSPDGVERGVMAAAAIIFFAFYGFDAISTAAEETKNPERNLPIGIIGSMLLCTLIYVLISVSAVGALPFKSFSASPEPLAHILREMGRQEVAKIIGAAAVIALPTVLLAFLFGQTRVFMAMARDGFLPASLAKISKRGTPQRVILVTAAIVAVLAGLLPLDEIAALANAGTLIAFMSVGACLIILRRREPETRRPFRVPAAMLVGAITILGCAYLFLSLPSKTQLWFFIWNGIGLLIYLLYGRMRKTV